MARPLLRGAHQQLNRMAGVSPSTKTFTPKQGQYLAYIHLYTRLHRRPPAETDIQEYFRVSPPSVHQMVLTLERAGLITRQPRTPRSIKVLVDSKLLPELISRPHPNSSKSLCRAASFHFQRRKCIPSGRMEHRPRSGGLSDVGTVGDPRVRLWGCAIGVLC